MAEIKPQFIQAAGVELVVLTRAEFDALLARPDAEDASDAALFQARMSELRHGQDERLPAEVSAFMLGGDSLLCALRKWRRKSPAELANMIGLSEDAFGAIELGTKPSAEHLLRNIAVALDVPSKWVL